MASNHLRITGPMLLSPRCGAKTRSGSACRSPAVRCKKRCRMHGGAAGSGAPEGNQNALKHGVFTKKAGEERQQIGALIAEARKLLKDLMRANSRPMQSPTPRRAEFERGLR